SRRPPRASVFATVGMVAAVVAAYLSLRLPAEHLPVPVSPREPVLVRPIVVARAVAEYAGLLVCPLRLHMERDVETHPSGFDNASLNAAASRELHTLVGIILIGTFGYALWRTR